MHMKTSIRLFNKTAVRAVWDNAKELWWYSATDVIAALRVSTDSRRYWNNFKKRHPDLTQYCNQFKMRTRDGKTYNTDCITQNGIDYLLMILPVQRRKEFSDWIRGMSDPVDERSKQKAYELYDGSLLKDFEVGTIKGLQQIHAYLFEGLYDFAGKIRTKNISKGGFMFANCEFFDVIFHQIDNMPQDNVDEIIQKYIEMNIAHPFLEGNGRATRIWLDLILKKQIGLCVDWQLVDKKAYLHAMEISPQSPEEISALIKSALTSDIENRVIFLKGIDYSYYYESVDGQ